MSFYPNTQNQNNTTVNNSNINNNKNPPAQVEKPVFKKMHWTSKSENPDDPTNFYEYLECTSTIFQNLNGLVYGPLNKKEGYMVHGEDLWTYKLNPISHKIEGVTKISDKNYKNARTIECVGPYVFLFYIEEVTLLMDIYIQNKLFGEKIGGELVRSFDSEVELNSVFSYIYDKEGPNGQDSIVLALKKMGQLGQKYQVYFFKIVNWDIYFLGKQSDFSPLFIHSINNAFFGFDESGKVCIYDHFVDEISGAEFFETFIDNYQLRIGLGIEVISFAVAKNEDFMILAIRREGKYGLQIYNCDNPSEIKLVDETFSFSQPSQTNNQESQIQPCKNFKFFYFFSEPRSANP